MPAGQAEKAQLLALAAPCARVVEPGEQEVQFSSAVAPETALKGPFGHTLHALRPGAEPKLPGSQGRQAAGVLAPGLLLYVPRGHSAVQNTEPALSA